MIALYAPPDGYYDLPFTWIYDTSAVPNGSTLKNQQIQVQGGFGDFLCRRVVGTDRVLNPATGAFQLYDKVYRPIESDTVRSANVFDLPILPELFYPEQGAIRFDLYNTLRTTEQSQGALPIYSSQLAFQGVRRLKGTNPFLKTYNRYQPKSFTYVWPSSIPVPAFNGAGQPTPVTPIYLKIVDFDFELFDVKIAYVGNASAALSSVEPDTQIVFTAVVGGALGNGITITVMNSGGGNLPLTVTTAGTIITVQVATDGAGAQTSTTVDVSNSINADPLASQLVVASVPFGPLVGTPLGTAITAGGGVPANGCLAALWLYDSNRMTVSSIPMLDVFMNSTGTTPTGAPSYNNGAVVPPLLYPKDSIVRIDVQSLSPVPVGMLIHLVGRQRIPC